MNFVPFLLCIVKLIFIHRKCNVQPVRILSEYVSFIYIYIYIHIMATASLTSPNVTNSTQFLETYCLNVLLTGIKETHAGFLFKKNLYTVNVANKEREPLELQVFTTRVPENASFARKLLHLPTTFSLNLYTQVLNTPSSKRIATAVNAFHCTLSTDEQVHKMSELVKKMDLTPFSKDPECDEIGRHYKNNVLLEGAKKTNDAFYVNGCCLRVFIEDAWQGVEMVSIPTIKQKEEFESYRLRLHNYLRYQYGPQCDGMTASQHTWSSITKAPKTGLDISRVHQYLHYLCERYQAAAINRQIPRLNENGIVQTDVRRVLLQLSTHWDQEELVEGLALLAKVKAELSQSEYQFFKFDELEQFFSEQHDLVKKLTAKTE